MLDCLRIPRFFAPECKWSARRPARTTNRRLPGLRIGVSAGGEPLFQFDVPAASLPPGLYTCQVNVVYDVAGTFTFPRMQLYVRK